MMTTDTLTTARAHLLSTARRDMRAGMSLAVPFVLGHPTDASVLSDLAAIAAASDADWTVFRSALRELFNSALGRA